MSKSMGERLVALGWMSAEVCRAETEDEALAAVGSHIRGLFDADWAGVGPAFVQR